MTIPGTPSHKPATLNSHVKHRGSQKVTQSLTGCLTVLGVWQIIIRTSTPTWEFPKIRGVPYFGVLIIRILLFRVLS